MYIVLTTLPHYLILLVPLRCNSVLATAYPWLIGSTTTASALWHASQLLNSEFVPFLYVLDYSLTGLWFITDLVLAASTWDLGVFMQVLYLNLATGFLHEIQKQYMREQYDYYHSLWHLLSAAKGIAVALLLQCPAYNGGQKIGNLPYNSLYLDKDSICQV